MTSIKVRPLQDNLSFGARVGGVTEALLQDEAVRQEIRDLFEDRGMIIFENVEPSSRMHVAVSNVFGPLKDHPSPVVARVDQDSMPGVIDMHTRANDSGVVELNGRRLSSWLPWHFDHCYNNELNRAGVLRAIEIAPEGGLTGFCDGIELYKSLSPELLKQIEDKTILYKMDVIYATMRFGRPQNFKELFVKAEARAVNEAAAKTPRALHPAVWTRKSGEKVLHVSPWMAQGIQGAENADGDALFEAVCQDINAKATASAYYHRWNLTDMLIWDNWRMLHSVSGMDPSYSRRMQRTTIKGDYGLGAFENGGVGDKILEMTV
jgi:taurine dioxygenase